MKEPYVETVGPRMLAVTPLLFDCLSDSLQEPAQGSPNRVSNQTYRPPMDAPCGPYRCLGRLWQDACDVFSWHTAWTSSTPATQRGFVRCSGHLVENSRDWAQASTSTRSISARMLWPRLISAGIHNSSCIQHLEVRMRTWFDVSKQVGRKQRQLDFNCPIAPLPPLSTQRKVGMNALLEQTAVHDPLRTTAGIDRIPSTQLHRRDPERTKASSERTHRRTKTFRNMQQMGMAVTGRHRIRVPEQTALLVRRWITRQPHLYKQ